MGRTLFLEKLLEDNVNQLFTSQNNKVQIGLILGQQTELKDFAIHLVRCPDPVDDEAEIEMSSSEDDVVVVKKNEKKLESKSAQLIAASSGNEMFDVKWIAEHGRQVSRMLAGGISVLGIFIFCPPDIITKSQAKLSQCLTGLQNRIEKNKWLQKSYLHSERYLLHICSLTRKLTCRTTNLSENQGVFKPAEFRFQTFLSSWHSVNSTIDISINICVPLSKKATETEQLVLLACQGEIEQIWNAYTTEGSQLLDEETIIQTSGKSKGKPEIGKEMKFTLFKTPTSKGSEDIINYESTNLEVKFFGAIQAKAILNSKATYGNAIKALKIDIIRSLLTRIELLCEEAEVNNLDHVPEWSLVSPTRVFLPFSNSELYFCDYSFKDESAEDIIARFSELLNISPKVSGLEYSERSPDVSEASMLFHSPEKNNDQQSDIASEISNSILEESFDKKIIYFLIALAVLLVSVAIHLTWN